MDLPFCRASSSSASKSAIIDAEKRDGRPSPDAVSIPPQRVLTLGRQDPTDISILVMLGEVTSHEMASAVLSRKGTNMAKFERVHFLRASLSPGEAHLYSFQGFFCQWDRGRFSGKEAPILIEGADLLGHVTTTRLIIEPRRGDSLSIVLRAIGPNFLEKIVPDAALLGGLSDMQKIGKETMKHLADQVGYLSFDFADMDHLGVFSGFACWPVMKYSMNGRDPAFLPHTIYRINQYTGPIVGPPAPNEFAEVIRDQGVRIVTYTAEASLP